MVRFVLLDVALRLWNVVPSAIGYVTKGIPYSIFFIGGEGMFEDLEPTSPTMFAVIVAPHVVSLAFSLVYWFIAFGIGWPLLRDTCHLLRIPLKSLFDIPFLGRTQRRKQAS